MSKPKKKSAITKLQEIMQYYTVDFLTEYSAMKAEMAFINRGDVSEKYVLEQKKQATEALAKGWGLVIVRVKPEYIDKADFTELRQWCLSLHVHVLIHYKDYMSQFQK